MPPGRVAVVNRSPDAHNLTVLLTVPALIVGIVSHIHLVHREKGGAMLSHLSLAGIDAAAKIVFEVCYDSLHNTYDTDAMTEVELIEGWVKLVDTTATDTVALPQQCEAIFRKAYLKVVSEYINGPVAPATALYAATVCLCVASMSVLLEGEPVYAALRRLLDTTSQPVAA